jgi:hypothetical protein
MILTLIQGWGWTLIPEYNPGISHVQPVTDLSEDLNAFANLGP